jgi:hypothetical protein
MPAAAPLLRVFDYPLALSDNASAAAPALGPALIVLYHRERNTRSAQAPAIHHGDLTMRGVKRLVVATVAALATGAVANAGNLTFLAESPSGHFNSEDVRLQREAAKSLLLQGEVGASREWHNPQSTAAGKITVTKVFKSTEGFPCKKLRFDNSAEGWHGRASYAICEIHPGDWKLHSQATPAPSKPASPDKGAN